MSQVNTKIKLNTISYNGILQEAGGRQGRLVGYKKANFIGLKLMNLVWGLQEAKMSFLSTTVVSALNNYNSICPIVTKDLVENFGRTGTG